MWAFIISLFGFIYLIYKYLCESSTRRTTRRNKEEIRARESEFFSKYAFPSYDWERIRNWFSINDESLRSKYYKDINETEKEIEESIGVKATSDMTSWGVLAKQGRIPPEGEFCYRNTYQLSYKSVRGFDYCFYDFTPEERNWFFIKFLKWYDRTIRENGMEYSLVYARKIQIKGGFTYTLSETIGSVKDISENDDPFLIVAYWEPIRDKVEGMFYL